MQSTFASNRKGRSSDTGCLACCQAAWKLELLALIARLYHQYRSAEADLDALLAQAHRRRCIRTSSLNYPYPLSDLMR